MASVTKRDGIWYLHWSDPMGKKHGRSLKTKSKRLADDYLRVSEYRRAQRELNRETGAELGKLQDGQSEYSSVTESASTYARPELHRIKLLTEGMRKGPPRTVNAQGRQPLAAPPDAAATRIGRCLPGAS